jgi:asparagine synthase (glutamine-hydrolysing)
MTGNYGGEILRAVRGFKPEQPLPGLFNPEVVAHVRRATEAYGGFLRQNPVSFAVFKQSPLYQYGVLALEQTQLALRSPYLDNDFVRTVFRAPESTFSTNELSLRLIADGNAPLLQIPTDRGLGRQKGILSAAWRQFLEFQFKAEYAYDMGMPQWLARIDHVLSPLRIERLFLGRHKVFHFRVWYRSALAGYIREMLLDSRSLSRPYIERKGMEAVVRGHLKGNRNYTTELHKLLTLEIIQRLFLDNSERGGTKGRPSVPELQMQVS